jgi:hypothetical protein
MPTPNQEQTIVTSVMGMRCEPEQPDMDGNPGFKAAVGFIASFSEGTHLADTFLNLLEALEGPDEEPEQEIGERPIATDPRSMLNPSRFFTRN